MASSTELRIVKRFEDGQTGDVAVGEIDTLGTITIERTAPGQEDVVAQLVEELNGTDTVYEKRVAIRRTEEEQSDSGLADIEGVPVADETPVETTLVKEAFDRGSPGFFDALSEMTKRFYAIELQFDASTLVETIQADLAAAEAERAAAEQESADREAAEELAMQMRVAAAKEQAAALEADQEDEDG